MAFDLPVNTPLTESQSELNAKISSMKSLLSLSSGKKLNIPKSRQVSTYDFLKKIINTLGFTLEPLFLLLINKIFDEAGDFLEKKVLKSMAVSLANKGTGLPNNQTPTSQLTPAIIKEYESQNFNYLKSRTTLSANFLSVAKQQIAKDLVLMLFGPQNSPASEYLNPDPVERERLIKSAICASFGFSMSNEPIIRNEDIEYNRIALARQLESGKVTFKIDCQDVKIGLPDNPSIIFEGGGQFTEESSSVTPAQSISFLIEYVGNEVQRINNEKNKASGGRSFFEILIEKLTGYISTLVYSHLGPVFSEVNATPVGASYTPENTVYSTCDIMNDPDNESKKQFGKDLANAIHKALLSILLVFVIKEFKKLVSNYFAKIALERQKRKLEKIKQRFKKFENIAKKADKVLRYKEALLSLKTILEDNTA